MWNLYRHEALAPKEGIKEPSNQDPQKYKGWNIVAVKILKCTTWGQLYL